MRRIIITDEIDQMAKAYARKMSYVKERHGVKSRGENNLQKLIAMFRNGYCHGAAGHGYITYLQKIKEEYLSLLTIHPKDFDEKSRGFERIIEEDDLSNIITQTHDENGGRLASEVNKPFYEMIVKEMRYDYVQGTVFPDFIRKLGIKSCVYCNAQYAIVTRNDESLFQLDHCYPKSLFPYFCVSFFNLQPCCGACNQRKSNTHIHSGRYNVSLWREKTDTDDSYFDFHITDDSLSAYLAAPKDNDGLEIDMVVRREDDADLVSLCNTYNEKFRVKDVYFEHQDEIEEIIWKRYIYTASYFESLKGLFVKNFGEMESEFKRLLLGTYTHPDDVYKRPLSKMKQDVARQLKMDLLLEE